MGYLRNFSSLEERASAQVAINLCQENAFKEAALCLEKPTYGAFISKDASSFVSDPEKLSIWAKMKETNVEKYDWPLSDLIYTCSTNDKKRKERWDATIEEQCQRLTEGLPRLLKQGIHAWIKRIALEYLSYSRRQEVLFGLSRYFIMDVLTTGDWTEAGRLDEEKVAKRLLEDELLTVYQRYRIACVYCLHVNISQLWQRLTQEDEEITGIDGYPSEESHPLVSFWSQQMYGFRKKVTRQNQWIYAAQQAVHYGNRAALMSCWKKLKEHTRHRVVMNMALQSLKKWQSILYAYGKYGNEREKLFTTNLPSTLSDESIKNFNLPSYYTELMCFFLSEMDEEQQMTFFNKAFRKKYCDSVLECFLDWPHQDNFLPTINRLWGIIPKVKYGKCLLTLASKCNGDDNKENLYCDYRSLLWMLWEKTPEEYKQYVFREKNLINVRGVYLGLLNEGEILLPRLLEKSPFDKKDESLFKEIFFYQPPEKRRAMMRCNVGKNICVILTQKEKWSFLNWLLEECLSKEEIPSYKKEFLQSDYAQNLCCSKLRENCEKFVEDLIDWSFTLDAEKAQCKYELINGNICLYACETFLIEGKFTDVERLINFCLSSYEVKEQFKVHLARHTCRSLLNNCSFLWKQMDKILGWSLAAEEKIREFKKDLFSDIGVYSHYESVFRDRKLREVQSFYKWFNLSSEEIKELKKDTMFYDKVIDAIAVDLYSCGNSYLEPLHYCATDRKMIISFKKEVEERCFKDILYKSKQKAKERFDQLVSKLLYSFKEEEVQDKTSRECVFVKDKGEKRSIVTADESNSPKKRFK